MDLLLLLHKKINGWYIFFIGVLFFLCSYFIVGTIPVNNGTGWDGTLYYGIIDDIVKNGWHITDPYRTIRLTAFPQLILLREMGMDKNGIVLFQFILNSLLLSLACTALYHAIINLKLGKTKALAASCLMFFTWPVVVMVPFYPILGDHMALALSCFSLWSWSKNNRLILILITFYSVWVFPTLFVVPLILLVFPTKEAIPPKQDIIKKSFIISILLAILIGGFVAYSIKEGNYLLELPTHALDYPHNKSNSLTSIEWLTGVSFILSLLMVLVYCFTLLKLINNRSFWLNIDIRCCIGALATAVISFSLMRYLIDFNQGFSGPPLVKYLILQSLSAPAKSIVAHFLYFGPVFPIVYYAICKRGEIKIPVAIKTVLIAFMLPMIFGSESRQWLVVLPLIIVAAMYRPWGPAKSLIVSLFTAITLLPMLILKFSIHEAVRLGDGLQDSNWQNYFIYQGPWMNTSAYKIAFALLILFSITYYFASYIDRQSTERSSK